MIKKTITYTDFNGQEVTEDHYFHLSKAQIFQKEADTPGGYSALLQQIHDSAQSGEVDGALVMRVFNEFIDDSYGVKSEDGRRFIRGGVDQFRESPGYDAFFMEICTDADKLAEFVNGVMPAGIESDVERIAAAHAERTGKSNVFESAAADKVASALTPEEGTPPAAEPISPISEPRVLSEEEIMNMDGDELRSGLATGKYRLS